MQQCNDSDMLTVQCGPFLSFTPAIWDAECECTAADTVAVRRSRKDLPQAFAISRVGFTKRRTFLDCQCRCLAFEPLHLSTHDHIATLIHPAPWIDRHWDDYPRSSGPQSASTRYASTGTWRLRLECHETMCASDSRTVTHPKGPCCSRWRLR